MMYILFSIYISKNNNLSTNRYIFIGVDMTHHKVMMARP